MRRTTNTNTRAADADTHSTHTDTHSADADTRSTHTDGCANDNRAVCGFSTELPGLS